MGLLTRTYVRMTEREGQAMTEYALILAAIAVVCFVTYKAVGTSVVNLLNSIIADL